MRRSQKPTDRLRRVKVAGVALTVTGFALLAVSGPAAAADGWSRTPSAGTADATIKVASSASTLCQWVQPAPALPAADPAAPGPNAEPAGAPPVRGAVGPGEPQTFDGTSVEVRLERAGTATDLGTLAVTPGGAWAGSVIVPPTSVVGPGDYDLIVRCVVDRTDLDGRRTFDFDPLPFAVVDAPPPTTITIPTELVPPTSVTNPNPVEVQGAQVGRGTTTGVATKAAAVPTLPKTGDGTLGVALAGIAAVLLGAGALWWGSRYARTAGRA